MPRVNIDGIGIEFEVHGRESDPAVVLTPGGRFTMDVAGLREFAQDLVEARRQVMIYDRPNCGYSDSCLTGNSEAEIQAEVLAQLVGKLDFGAAMFAGGSGGARATMMAAARAPQLCSHLALWWISGDPIGLMNLATYYCGEAATLASSGGMEAVMRSASWSEHFEKNPVAKEAMRQMDPQRFIAIMQKWARAYSPSDISPVPGMLPVDFAKLTMPTLVFRSDKSDLAHTEATSLWVHRLIPHSILAQAPWRPDEWNHQSGELRAGNGNNLFSSWRALAPIIVEFAYETSWTSTDND